MIDYPLVMIEWEDSRQPKSAWQWVSDFEKPEVVRCSSVGWLIHDGKDAKILAPNLGDTTQKEAQVSGVIQIPARCVVKTRKIRV